MLSMVVVFWLRTNPNRSELKRTDPCRVGVLGEAGIPPNGIAMRLGVEMGPIAPVNFEIVEVADGTDRP